MDRPPPLSSHTLSANAIIALSHRVHATAVVRRQIGMVRLWNPPALARIETHASSWRRGPAVALGAFCAGTRMRRAAVMVVHTGDRLRHACQRAALTSWWILPVELFECALSWC